MKEMTKRQKEVITFISGYINKNSFPPTIREVADHFSISVKGAHDHITALRRKGHLTQVDKRPRTMGLTHPLKSADPKLIKIPVLGTIAAGKPLIAEENFEGTVELPRSMLKKSKDYFALKIKGDSMIGAGILNGDMAIIEKMNTVSNGEIAAALVDDAATLKRIFKERSRIKLQAENPAIEPLYCDDVKIIGRLAGIIRNY